MINNQAVLLEFLHFDVCMVDFNKKNFFYSNFKTILLVSPETKNNTNVTELENR